MSLRSPGLCQHAMIANQTGAITGFGIAPIAGRRIYLYRLILTIGTPGVTVQIQDLTGAPVSQPFLMSTFESLILNTPPDGDPWYQTVPGQGLQLSQSGTTPISMDAWYLQAI